MSESASGTVDSPEDIRTPAALPFLRTLVPALRRLELDLRHWLDAPHRYPLSTMTRAALEGEIDNLHRQAESLDVDRPTLLVVFMGGTGVGKSTLLNALAGGSIADASFTRPTTRDPVVYYHESHNPDRFDPAVRQCRLAVHDRPALREKILVDTPDLDSNDLANREKLARLLPVADVVLYVGSQEKYHDKLGWELFRQQRKRRAFAFVLNKWDRCSRAAPNGGIRPDEDLLRDLREEGFQDPLLFRTCAQHWVDQAESTNQNGTPDGEQFQDLVHWLEMGLTRLEIEAIKARGVSQLLAHTQQALEGARPPDLTGAAQRVRGQWGKTVDDEAAMNSEILLNALEPYQREIEHHFSREGYKRFRGLMAVYLNLFMKARYVGSSLRDRVRVIPKLNQSIENPGSWDLYTFTSACTSTAGERHLDARGRALANKLLVEADADGFPVELLAEPTENAAKLDWRQRYARILVEVLDRIEQQWVKPTGARRWFQSTVIWWANKLPLLALLGTIILLLWEYMMAQPRRPLAVGDILLPIIAVFLVLFALHVLIHFLLPMRWESIRGEFQRQLAQCLKDELEAIYLPIPGDVAEAIKKERKQIEQLLRQTREVSTWVEQREQAADTARLYGA